jgi:integrase/recombinase XerD
VVAKGGSVADNPLRPHDLKRHGATYASRSGVPIEIVSKVILRHQNLSTIQGYLGKISDQEAIKLIDNLYA